MFTGIIEEIGEVIEIDKSLDLVKVKILAEELSKEAKSGESISVNGVCLTVTDKKNPYMFFEVISQTLNETTLRNLSQKNKINLESSLSINKGISGHLVTGHVDTVGKIINIKNLSQKQVEMCIEVHSELMKFIVEKGSICVDGVSLTVAKVKDNNFCIYLTPYTLTNTTLKERRIDEEVNIEVDLIVRYLEKLVFSQEGTKLDKDFLRKHGFI